MSLRRISQPDSLELLLDTICNTFGGIILIALLVALIARDAKVSEDSSRAAKETTEMSQRRLAKAMADLAQAQAFQADLEAKSVDPRIAGTKDLFAQRRALREKLEAIQKQDRDSVAKLAEFSQGNVTNLSSNLKTLQDQLNDLNRQRAELQKKHDLLSQETRAAQTNSQVLNAQAAQVGRDQTRALRLPRVHDTAKEPLEIIVRYGHLYPVNVFLHGQKTLNTTVLSLFGGIVLLNPSQGLDPARNAADLLAYYKQASTSNYYLVFHVFADSFEAFNLAKQAAISQGFEYAWVPLENSQVIGTGGSGSAPSPQ